MEKKDHHGKRRWREKVWGSAHVCTGCMCYGVDHWASGWTELSFHGPQKKKNKNEKQQNQRALPAHTLSPVCKNQTLQNRRQQSPDAKSANGLGEMKQNMKHTQQRRNREWVLKANDAEIKRRVWGSCTVWVAFCFLAPRLCMPALIQIINS